MSRYVAWLRGINVGPAQRIAMADLRALVEALGYRHVRTLRNSGNVIFDGPARATTYHAGQIHEAIAATLGLQVPVIVKSAGEMAAVVAGNALQNLATDPSRLMVVFTARAQALPGLARLGKLATGAEQLHIGEHAAYLWCANGVLQSKVALALLAGLGEGEIGTTRNWATTLKVHSLLQRPAD